MSSISKTQIDRLGERLREGPVSDKDLRELEDYCQSFAEAYDEVAKVIADVLSGTMFELTGRRRKTPFSIIEKLRREKKMKLSRMQDITGCRVVVADVTEQDHVVQRLSGAFATRPKVVDRRREPSNGYRAIHVIPTIGDKTVEIQVRTKLQDLWAQQSEVMSDRTDPRIKYGAGDPDAQSLLLHNSKWIADIEKAEQELADRKTRLAQNLKKLNEIIKSLPRRVN